MEDNKFLRKNEQALRLTGRWRERRSCLGVPDVAKQIIMSKKSVLSACSWNVGVLRNLFPETLNTYNIHLASYIIVLSMNALSTYHLSTLHLPW